MNLFFYIIVNWLEDKFIFFKDGHIIGIEVNLLFYKYNNYKFFKFFIEFGNYYNSLKDKFSSTKAFAFYSYFGNVRSLFFEKSKDFKFNNVNIVIGIFVNKFDFILISWISGKLGILLGNLSMLLFDKSIFVIGLHYHQFWSSKFKVSILNTY
jgi:hypothetical protein